MSVDPLVDPATDLRDFAFMPLDIVRLFNSQFHALSDDSAWRAGVTLWLKSYHQVPASSIPDDDIALARLAELGRDQRTWKRIRAAALRGWVKCNDGRLYHPVVAEKAIEGWIEKIAQRKASEAGNCKRYGKEFDPKPFDEAMERSRQRLAALNPQSRALSKRNGKYAPGSPGGSNKPPETPPDGSANTPEKPRKGQGRDREGTGTINSNLSLRSDAERDSLRDRFFQVYPRFDEPDDVWRYLDRLLDEGVDFADIEAGAKRYAVECSGRKPQHISAPMRWLQAGRWKTGNSPTMRVLPVVLQDSPQGRAWDESRKASGGKGMFWHNGRRTVETEWPPGWPSPQREAAE